MKIVLNRNHLDREARLLLTISALHAISLALSNTFVNVYLWKIKQNLVLIGWYNLSQYVAVGLTFILAGWLTKKVDRVIAIRLGVAIQAIFFLTVLLMGTKATSYVILLGAFLGVGSGFFWLAYNVLYFEITDRENRDYFNGINGFINALAGIVAPVISGLIITRIDHFTGYRIIFGISLVIFIGAVGVSFFLKSRSAFGRFRLLDVIQLVKKKKSNWFWVNLAMLSQGIREGVFIFITGLLVFITTNNELTLGMFYTVCNLVSLVAYYFVGKWMKPARRKRSMFFGALAMGVFFLPYLILMKTWTMFLYGIGFFLFSPFYYNPLLSIVFDEIGQSEKTVELRVEYVVSREIALNLGRVISVLGFLWWIIQFPSFVDLRWFLLPISFIQLLTWWYMKKVSAEKAASFS